MNVLVPTRNNPAALASLLGSLIAVTHDIMGSSQAKHDLFLMDSSDEPVLTHPHLARLLTRFNLHYQHFLEPQVNVQRIEGLVRVVETDGPNAITLISDDDHILVSDPAQAFSDMVAEPVANAYFGIAADILNDKGYRDFKLHSPVPAHHSLPTGQHPIDSYACPDLATFSANPGLLVCRALPALESLKRCHAAHPTSPAVADDAWARTLAVPPLIHTAVVAMHVGNSNRWWNNHTIKHTAVNLAVAQQLKEGPPDAVRK